MVSYFNQPARNILHKQIHMRLLRRLLPFLLYHLHLYPLEPNSGIKIHSNLHHKNALVEFMNRLHDHLRRGYSKFRNSNAL